MTGRLVIAFLAAAIAVVPVGQLAAQDRVLELPAAAGEKNSLSSLPVPLPENVSTKHSVDLPGRKLQFTATAGSHSIRDAAGLVLADVGFTSYVLDGPAARTRPLVFAFNGGPGSSSTWLHLGAMGPWRVPLTAETIAGGKAPELLANAETWLDFADLVFIDPPGTGQSQIWPRRSVGEGAGQADNGRAIPREGSRGQRGAAADRQSGGTSWFWSVRGDVETFTEVIRALLRQTGRADSPIVLVGESYGGFRAPLIADSLMRDHGIGVSALVLASPVLDFDARRGNNLPMHYVNLLPSLAATRLEREGSEPSRAVLADVERYARGEFLTDLVRGARDEAAVGRIAAGVAALTGLQADSVRAMAGRISARTFVRASPLFGQENVSLYDAGMSGLGPREGRQPRGGGDAFTNGLSLPLTEAIAHLHARLGWTSARPYVLLSHEVGNAWIWRNSPYPPQALDALQNVMQADQRRRVLVAHGFTDLVTPYLASAIQLDQLPLHGAANGGGDRIHFEVYPGGHMFYSRDASRARFRADSARVVGGAVQPLSSTTGGQRETP